MFVNDADHTMYDVCNIFGDGNDKKDKVTETTLKLLSEASALLDVKYLEDASGPVEWPVHGILYGPYKYPLICLPTASSVDGAFRNIIYLVNPCAIKTELEPIAFCSLFDEKAMSFAAHADINGTQCHVHNGKLGISVLGADYMSHCKLTLLIDYATNTVTWG